MSALCSGFTPPGGDLLQAGVEVQQSGCRKITVSLRRSSAPAGGDLLEAGVEGVVDERLGVGPHVERQRQRAGRVDAGARRVQVELPHRDAHPCPPPTHTHAQPAPAGVIVPRSFSSSSPAAAAARFAARLPFVLVIAAFVGTAVARMSVSAPPPPAM